MTPPGWSIFARPALHEDVENRCQTPGRSGTRLTRAFRRRRALCQKHERQSGLKGMVWSLGRGSKCKFKPFLQPRFNRIAGSLAVSWSQGWAGRPRNGPCDRDAEAWRLPSRGAISKLATTQPSISLLLHRMALVNAG